jgi:hypothetical protein
VDAVIISTPGIEATYAWIAAQVKAGRQSVGKPGQATFPVTPTAP